MKSFIKLFFRSKQANLKKSHTCKEGGAHLRISFWHLFMNLKKKYFKNSWSRSMLCLEKNIEKHLAILLFYTLCQKSQGYYLQFLRYGVWWNEIFNFGSFFALLPHLKLKKPRFWKDGKNCWIIASYFTSYFSSFYTCVPKMMIIWCMLLELQSETGRIFVILGHFLPFYSPNNPVKIFKKWKKHLDVSSFYTCVSKIIIMWCMLPEIWMGQA